MMKYVGADKGYISGVPARDLTAAEAKKFGKLIAEQQKLTGLVLYQDSGKAKSEEKT